MRKRWVAVAHGMGLAAIASASPLGAHAQASEASAPPALDRYGGGEPHPALAAPRQGYLAWSGKSEPIAPPATEEALRARYEGPVSAPPPPPIRASAAAPSAGGGPSGAPAATVPQPPDRAAAGHAWVPGQPRFYSVHRDYGLQPDAIPLPPQFFGATADLSQSPPDPQVRRTTTAGGQIRTAPLQDGDTP